MNFALSSAGNAQASFIYQEDSNNIGVQSQRLLDWIRTATYDDATDTASTGRGVINRSELMKIF